MIWFLLFRRMQYLIIPRNKVVCLKALNIVLVMFLPTQTQQSITTNINKKRFMFIFCPHLLFIVQYNNDEGDN